MDTDSNPPPSNPPPPSSPPPPPPLSSGPPPVIPVARSLPPRRSGGRGWRVAAVVLAILLGLSLLFNLSQMMDGVMTGTPVRSAGPQLDEVVTEYNHSPNKIAVVPIEGIISSDMFDPGGYNLVDYVQDQLKLADRDEQVKAVLLKVNSPGGEVLASDEIYNAVANFQKESGKPVVAAMGSVAASGGYYVSAPCRWIVADELTITGSIGVIMQSFNFRELMDKVGVVPQVYKSGRYKDMLSATKKPEEVTPEERQMVQQLIDETYVKFKDVVTEGRQQAAKWKQENADGQGRALDRNWTEVADGRVLSGRQALEVGLVDELGNWDAAVERAKKLANIENANLVQYHQRFDLSSFFRLFGKSESKHIKVDVGLDAPKLKAGYLYFLAPTFVH